MSRPAGFWLWLAAAACAPAQVTLSTVQGGVATPAGEAYDFGTVAVGSVATAEFRLTNTGTAGIYLTSLALDGPTSGTPPYTPYFSVMCSSSPDLCGAASHQQLPILINPAGTLDFTVQFQPFQPGSPSATMTIAAGNTITTFLTGTGVPGLSVVLNGQPLSAGATITFGSVQVGSSQTVKLMLSNPPGNPPVAVPAIPPLAGGAFSLTGPALSGPTVAPGSAAELDVLFAPAAAGPQQAALTIGLLTYVLAGTGVAPPPPAFPAPSIAVNLPSPASAQQGGLSVSLASASPASGSGTVTLVFQPAVSGVSDDPAVTFADGTRSAAFTVAKGSAAGQFAAGPSASFGTGTTAGTLVFTVTLGSNSAHANVVIPPALVGIDAAVAQRDVACAPSELYCTATNVELQINGWDNTRSMSQLVFSFFDSSGQAISPGNITVAASTPFAQYFAGSDLGGVFGLHALFPVNGDSNQVVAAVVQFTNSAGAVQTNKITF